MSRILSEPVNVAALLRSARDLIRQYAPVKSSEADRVATGLHRLANIIDMENRNAQAAHRR